MDALLKEIRSCTLCKEYLPFEPRPVLRAHPNARIAIIGQAPGTKVHESGIPWNDASGKQLRRWMEVTEEDFYNPEIFAIVPMGFCYPGKGLSGDLPPRKECAMTWHHQIFQAMPNIRLTILIGQYAQGYYLPDNPWNGVTETVKNFAYFPLNYFPLPHPSPRNNIWLKKNPWFDLEIIPVFRNRLRQIL